MKELHDLPRTGCNPVLLYLPSRYREESGTNSLECTNNVRVDGHPQVCRPGVWAQGRAHAERLLPSPPRYTQAEKWTDNTKTEQEGTQPDGR